MTVKELREILEGFDSKSEVVIQTQKGHQLFADIREIEESEDDENILIMQFCNEGYSPEQALKPYKY